MILQRTLKVFLFLLGLAAILFISSGRLDWGMSG
jgi:hypothetical protein